MSDVLEGLSRAIAGELAAVRLFDLPAGPTIYRVFLLPGCLQLDLSLSPESDFGAAGPRFRLLFGRAVERSWTQPPAVEEQFGLAVHHIVRTRLCVERGRLWQAEHWLSGARDLSLAIACHLRGLPTAHGRGFDELPADVLARLAPALVSAVEREELLRALDVAIEELLRCAADLDGAAEVGPWLRELTVAGALA